MAKQVTIDFNANLTRFTSSIDKATDQLNRFEKNSQRMSKNLSRAFRGLATVLPVAALGAATKRAIDYADSIANAADRTAFTTTKLQELKFAASQNDIAFNTLEAGLARFTKRLGLARMGTGAAADTYRKLGIDLKQTNDQVFDAVAATLGGMATETDRLALATRLFGDDAQVLGKIFRDGNRGLQEYADQARELGLVLSDDLVQGASEANDQLDIMKSVLNAQFVSVFVELAPVITSIGQAFANAAPKVAQFFNSFGDVDELSLQNLEERAKRAQEEYSRLQEKIQRTEAIQAARTIGERNALGFEFGDAFLPDDEDELNELRERMKRQEEIFKESIERIKTINSEAKEDVSPTSSSGAGNLDGLFASAGAKGSTGQTKAQKERNALLREAQRLFESTRTPLEVYNAQVARLNELTATGAINDETKLRALEKYQEEFDKASGKAQLFADLQSVVSDVDPVAPLLDQLDKLEELETAFPEYADIIGEAMLKVHEEIDKVNEGLDGQVDQAEKTKDAWQDLGPVFSSAFEDAIVEGKGLSDVLKGLEKDILRIATRKLVTEPLGGFFSDFFSSSGTGGGFLGGLFGGFRAQGGYVGRDKAYLVGEQGPELFQPSTSGHVYSNAETTRMASNVTINVNGVTDADSFRRNEAQIMRNAQRALGVA